LTLILNLTERAVKNPLPFELTLKRVSTDAGLNGTVFASFDQTFTRFVVPPLGSANSGTFGNVELVQGATASLGIIPFGELDIIEADIELKYVTINCGLVFLAEVIQSVTVPHRLMGS
jgi:hypothetical protein